MFVDILLLLWGLWHPRNTLDPLHTVRRVKPPPLGCIKINVDGACPAPSGAQPPLVFLLATVTDWLLPFASRGQPLQVPLDAGVVEAHAIALGVQLALELDATATVVESDALNIVRQLQDHILEIIRRFRASQFDLVKTGLKSEGDVISVNMASLKAGTPSPIPSEAEAGFDIRVPPTANTESLEKRIAEQVMHAFSLGKSWHSEKGTTVDYLGRPLITSTDSSNPWWTLLEEAIKKANGKVGKPEIFPASTDVCYFRQVGLPAIGFSPMANTPILLHDHNEFLNQAEYLKGIDVYVFIIKSYTSYIPSRREPPRDEL
ncbi:aminoacylase-1-like isoform X2 [Hibiscus syriacus]|uniref:Aminoacylase-1-like isoform X2 n=1 Tax=Hibiscus syriacus TaxID=106335 RepID=A0A6A2Z8J3_HIBSY|nr:aminoacylase-1-like isoform X2 [Hibiscus syriacus]